MNSPGPTNDQNSQAPPFPQRDSTLPPSNTFSEEIDGPSENPFYIDQSTLVSTLPNNALGNTGEVIPDITKTDFIKDQGSIDNEGNEYIYNTPPSVRRRQRPNMKVKQDPSLRF